MKIKTVGSIASLLLMPGLIGCEKAPDEPARGEAAVASQTSDAPTKREHFEGFSFELPYGWSRVSPDEPKTKAMLLLGGERWDVAKGMVKVDVGKPTSPDARATADGLAKNISGGVLPEPADVDGEQGIQVQASSHGATLSPIKAIVVFRGGRVYLIMAGEVAGTDVSDAFEHIRKTWKWDK